MSAEPWVTVIDVARYLGVVTASKGVQYVELPIPRHVRTATRTHPDSSHVHLRLNDNANKLY